jgi:hypothetical protein
MPIPNRSNSKSTLDHPVPPALFAVLPLDRWPSSPIAREYFVELAFRFLLTHGIVLETVSELKTLTRLAWSSAGLLLQTNPQLSLKQLRDHVENFMLDATSSCSGVTESSLGSQF